MPSVIRIKTKHTIRVTGFITNKRLQKATSHKVPDTKGSTSLQSNQRAEKIKSGHDGISLLRVTYDLIWYTK